MSLQLPRYAVVLAAGKGTRFRSEKPKVLHEVCGRPMISYLLDRLPEVGIGRTWVVVGDGSEQVRKALSSYSVEFAQQDRQLGTGHAVMSARSGFLGLTGSLIVLYGDTPLIPTETLEELFRVREQTGAAEVLLTVELENPTGYGRIVRDSGGRITDIVEEKEATSEQKAIREINAGFACIDVEVLAESLDSLRNDNKAGEYYLTDLVKILNAQGKRVETLCYPVSDDVFGINDRTELAAAENRLRKRINTRLMRSGVTLLDPEKTFIDDTVAIGPDTVVHPGAIILGQTQIGPSCVIGAYTQIQDSVLGEGVTIDHGSVVRGSVLEHGRVIDPHTFLKNEHPVSAGSPTEKTDR